MSCFILCQNCGEIYDSDETWGHVCSDGSPTSHGFCDNCGKSDNELMYNNTTGAYSHSDLRDCIKNLREEINHSEGHCIENDSRFCEIEKKLSEFVEGRRAAVEATKEKLFQIEGEDSELPSF